jgi:hypothetical protein
MFMLHEKKCSDQEFFEFWSRQYNYPNEHLYKNNIKAFRTETCVLQLFEWKNGRPLSHAKKGSVYKNYINEVDLISAEADVQILKDYLNRPGGAVWRIFWLHCNYPERFPIFDRHVYRAMAHIKNKQELEIGSRNRDKVDLYIKEYIGFYDSLKCADLKKRDEALWAFGRFLSYGYKL